MGNTIPVTSGSDATLQFAFQDGNAAAIAISAPTIIEATGGLVGLCTATLVDGAGGLASVFIEGSAPIALGTYFLRLQVTLAGGDTLASERLLINVR
jgi:hypothetical protein|tara:strand:- start:986 stop:1276 length:291 start_codon:yes stop_codon:yes gene_type:complete